MGLTGCCGGGLAAAVAVSWTHRRLQLDIGHWRLQSRAAGELTTPPPPPKSRTELRERVKAALLAKAQSEPTQTAEYNFDSYMVVGESIL